MKKSLLTLGAVLGISAGAFAQGSIIVQNSGTPEYAGFNTASSNPNDGTLADFPSGTMTLTFYSIGSAGNASLASQINADDAVASTVPTAVTLLQTDFTAQPIGATVGGETASQSFSVSEGDLTGTGVGNTWNLGTSSTITSGATVYYALLATMVVGGQTWQGALVFNNVAGYGAGGGTFPAANMNSIWPTQNMLLAAPVPEPTTLALAGLGGLSLLALRRRKA